MTQEEKAKRYDEALEIAKKNHVTAKDLCEDSQIGVECFKNTLVSIFPELEEIEDERIRKEIIEMLRNWASVHYITKKQFNERMIWLEKQGKHLENYYEAEKEKVNFVGDGFIKCFANFLDFKEGETYWLEYIGDDKYNVRSDNLLGKTYHITPCQLYTVFKKLTWFEKQIPIDKEKVLIGARKNIALSIMNFLDKNTLGMCLSSMECEDLEDAVVDSDWSKVYNYMKKKLEKQDVFSKKDVDDAYLKGVTDTKNEIEKQYEANSQIRKDIAAFILNYNGDIKDRAKWIEYLGIKVSFVKKKHRYIPEFLDQTESEDKRSIYNVPSREVILAIWDLGNEWKELTNGCISTKYGTQLNYIQKHWKESEYYLREKQGDSKDKISIIDKLYEHIRNTCACIEDAMTCNNTKDMKDYLIQAQYDAQSALDIIEKQGEQKTIEEVNGENYGIDGLWHAQRILEKTLGSVNGYQSDDGILEHKAAITAVKKLYEQKPTDKVEPNFHEGDWVVNKFGDVWRIDSFDKKNYQVSDGKGNYNYFPISKQNEMRLWTIQDAKDGDIVCYKDEISIYKHDIKNCTKLEETFGGFVYYCCYDGKRFITDSLYSLTEQDKMNIYPATEKQRTLLFQKIKEAGYEWDADKKESKKKEVK